MAVDESQLPYEHPLYDTLEHFPGLSLATTSLDKLLNWSARHSLWIFPMATSCCAIEFITAAASRVDIDQIGSVVRPTPRHCDVMVVAGTITVKMAPRVKKLWDQMPEPKWCIAMGSCAISGDFYRDIYSVIPGIDTVVLAGLKRLQELVLARRAGLQVPIAERPEQPKMINPDIRRVADPARDPELSGRQLAISRSLGLGGNESRDADDATNRQGGVASTHQGVTPPESP